MQKFIVYQAYGSIDHINECRYSLLKFLQYYNLLPPADVGICIYTDQPVHFEEFESFFKIFRIREISQVIIEEWRGKIDFVHRVKIQMLIDFFSEFEGTAIYFDTDTYIISSIDFMFDEINVNTFLMHEYEGTLNQNTSNYFGKWERFFKKNTIHYGNKQLEFSPQLKIWNAGVIGLSSGNRKVLDDVLSLTDSIYQKFPKHIAEQISFSYCFQKSGHVQSTTNTVAHYWDVKEFRTLLYYFFDTHKEESMTSLVKYIKQLNATEIQKEKRLYQQLPYFQKLIKSLSGKKWKIENYLNKV